MELKAPGQVGFWCEKAAELWVFLLHNRAWLHSSNVGAVMRVVCSRLQPGSWVVAVQASVSPLFYIFLRHISFLPFPDEPVRCFLSFFLPVCSRSAPGSNSSRYFLLNSLYFVKALLQLMVYLYTRLCNIIFLPLEVILCASLTFFYHCK